MGNRMLKDTIRTSRKVNAMTDFQFRVWIYLITYVDDYGRGSADPELLKGFVFPRRKRVAESDIEKTLAELAGMGCIHLYAVDGESYFCFPNWGEHQRIQTKRSKFPAPEESGSPPSTVRCRDIPSETETQTKTETEALPPSPPGEENYGFGPDLAAAFSGWLDYKREKRQAYRPTGLQNLAAQVKKQAGEYGEAAVAELIRECMASNWQGIVWDRLERTRKSGRPAEGGGPGAWGYVG